MGIIARKNAIRHFSFAWKFGESLCSCKWGLDVGLKVPCDEKIFPGWEGIMGLHIAKHLEKFKDLPKEFGRVKQKIINR